VSVVPPTTAPAGLAEKASASAVAAAAVDSPIHRRFVIIILPCW
jgi:hypothetical protein